MNLVSEVAQLGYIAEQGIGERQRKSAKQKLDRAGLYTGTFVGKTWNIKKPQFILCCYTT